MWAIIYVAYLAGAIHAYFLMCDRLDKGNGISGPEVAFALFVALASWFTVITLVQGKRYERKFETAGEHHA